MSTNPVEIKTSIEGDILKHFLNTPFIIQENFELSEPYVRLCLGPEAERVSVHYKGHFPVPRTPLFHPYNPNANPSLMHPSGIPNTVLTLKCPKETLLFLADNLKKVLEDSKINPDQIDISVITQNMPFFWTVEDPLLIRPHYWIHGDAQLDDIVKTGGALSTVCEVALCTTRTATLLCDGCQNIFPNPAKLLNISTHDTICSPNGIGVLSGVLPTQTLSFFSIVKAADGRTALTLHWLLNDNDQTALEDAALKMSSQQAPTLKMLMLHIAEHIPNLREPLEDLMRIFNTNLHKLQPPVTPYFNMQEHHTCMEVANFAKAAIEMIEATTLHYGITNARAYQKK
jgi:hypothetical protein